MSEIPASWKSTTMGDAILSVRNGRNVKQDKSGIGTPVSRIETIAQEEVNFDRVGYTCDEVDPDLDLLKQGDLLFSHINSATHLGKTAVFKGGQTLFHGINLLRIEPERQAVDPEFFHQQCRFMRQNGVFELNGQHAVNQSSINQKRLKELPFLIPPLPEQRRIIAKLDRLSARTKAARAHLARVQSLATRAKQATLTAAFRGDLTEDWRKRKEVAFPWGVQEVGKVMKIVTGNTPPTKEKANYGDCYPFAKPGDLDKGEISETDSALSERGFGLARKLPKGTVLVSCIGNLGKIGILGREGSCNQQINAILPTNEVLPRFAFYWAHTLKEWLEANSSATTVAIINKGRFSKASFPIVSLNEQTEIVRRIEAAFARIDRMVEDATRAAHLLDRLDQQLLAKAFRGELVPQDPNDEPAAELLARIKAARAAAPKPKRGRRQRA